MWCLLCHISTSLACGTCIRQPPPRSDADAAQEVPGGTPPPREEVRQVVCNSCPSGQGIHGPVCARVPAPAALLEACPVFEAYQGVALTLPLVDARPPIASGRD